MVPVAVRSARLVPLSRSLVISRSFSGQASSETSGGRRWLAGAGALVLAGGACTVGDGPASVVRSSDAFRWAADQVMVPLIRKVLDAEDAHIWTVFGLKCGLGPRESADLEVDWDTSRALSTRVFGLHFRNPVGMAAGFDKQAEVPGELLEVGFGFLEVGGVTPESQPGNPRPRCWRLLEDRAVINRYGLNSEGHAVVGGRLAAYAAEKSAALKEGGGSAWGPVAQPQLALMQTDGGVKVPAKYSGPIGVNLAKNTTSADTEGDYRKGVRALGENVQFLVVNVSCPNVSWTKGLKGSDIAKLIDGVRDERDKLVARTSRTTPLPVLLKIGPDGTDDELKGYVKLAKETKVDGLVVTNTSSTRPESLKSEHKAEQGGLSGAPLREMSLATIRRVYELSKGELPLVGVGGIFTGADAYARIRAGASLVQIYTAMVYEGPGVVHRIKTELAELLERDGFRDVAQAVGADHKKDGR